MFPLMILKDSDRCRFIVFLESILPPVSEAEYNGLLGLGGDLHPDRLLLVYNSGIFPWYSQGQPILWFSPDPRFVLIPQEFRISRSLKSSSSDIPFGSPLTTPLIK